MNYLIVFKTYPISDYPFSGIFLALNITNRVYFFMRLLIGR